MENGSHQAPDAALTRPQKHNAIAERLLHELDIDWRYLVESAPDIFFVVDSEGKILFINRAPAGFEPEQALGTNILDYVASEHCELVRRSIQRVFQEAAPDYYEVIACGPNDTLSWYATRCSPVQRDGQVVAALVIARDISRRKREMAMREAAYRISEAALKVESLDELYRAIHETVAGLVPARNLYIALYDPETDCVHYPYWVDDRDPQPPPYGVMERRGLTAYVVRTGQPLLATREEIERLCREGEVVLLGTMPYQWLGVPLQTKDRTTGVLVVQTYEDSVRRYDARDEELLIFMSAQVAMAIERVRAQEALRESENRYRRLFEDSVLGIFQTTLDGQILSVNPACARMFGYGSPGQFVAALASGAMAWYVDPERRSQALRRALESSGPRENRYVRSDGTTFTGIQRVWVVKDDAGNPLYVEGLIEDISDRKRTEWVLQTLDRAALAAQAALTREEVFAAVAREFGELGLLCTVFLLEQRRWLHLHYTHQAPEGLRAAEKLTGLSIEGFAIDLEATHVLKKVVEEKKTIFVGDPQEMARELLPPRLRGLARRLRDILRVSKMIHAPLIVEDQVIGILSVESNDLSQDDQSAVTAFAHQMAAAWQRAGLTQELEKSLEELRQAQARFVQAQKMEAIGRLAGGVAHDFNNILTTIQGYCGLAVEELASGNCSLEEARADLEEVGRAADQAAAVVRQLLAFSRKQVLQPQVMNLNTVVIRAEKMLRHMIGEDIELTLNLEPWLGRVKADPTQMEQVIMNLAVNARDAMPKGGKLALSTSNVRLDNTYTRAHPDARVGSHVLLAVSDTGVGMDEEVRSHLFEPFFTTKEPGRGTGLGLASVYGIVQQSEGSIDVWSEPGVGTNIRIYLPCIDEEPSTAADRRVSRDLLPGNETVLLVEDDEGVWTLAYRVLERCGYHVLAARHPGQALSLAAEYGGPIHLLVTDVVMPEMNGPELAGRLVESHPEIKVLYASGYTDDAIVQRGTIESGAQFLQKPFHPAELAWKVRAVLDS